MLHATVFIIGGMIIRCTKKFNQKIIVSKHCIAMNKVNHMFNNK